MRFTPVDYEQRRLEALDRYEILDTPPEERFDRLTEVAAHFFNVPAAEIVFADERRAWQKAVYGAGREDIPLEGSLRGIALLADGATLVEDVFDDVDLRESWEAAADGGIRFFASAPIRTPDGYVVGQFNILAPEPRPMGEEEMTFLKSLAGLVMNELEVRFVLGEQGHGREAGEQAEALQGVQSRLFEGEERWRRLVESHPDPILLLSGEGEILYANEAGVEVVGSPSQEEISGRPVFDFVEENAHPALRRALAAAHAGRRTKRDEVRVLRTDRSTRIVELSYAPVGYNGRYAVQTVLHDVTDRHRAIEALEATLEKERELNELKSRFISTASHELRTPLAAIQSSAELLERFQERWPVEKREALFRRIQANVRVMTRLLDDVLLLGRAEPGNGVFHPQPIDPYALVGSVLDEVRLGAGVQHRLIFRGEIGEVPLVGDEKLLRIVLTNLLNNAVKYSPAGSVVLTRAWQEGERLVLSVSDRGIGIPEADLPRLFEPFHRASNVEARSGTGLGLAIVKRIVDLHAGTIDVTSVEGEGTTFTLGLPFGSQSGARRLYGSELSVP